jgi:hypothetical protein
MLLSLSLARVNMNGSANFTGFSVEKLINRVHTPLEMQGKFEMALQLYSSANRLMFNKLEFRLELDASIRWCTLLMEQGGAKVYTLIFPSHFSFLHFSETSK